MCGDRRPAGGGDHRRFRAPAAVPPALLVVAAATAWGTTGTSRALGPDEASPVAVGAVRVALGGGILLALALRRGLRLRGWAPVPTTIAVAAIAAYQPLFFAGVSKAGVAIGTVVGIGTSPIAGGILGRVVRKEPLGPHWVVATALGIAGAVLLGSSGDAGDDVALGLLLAVGAGVAYAVYVAASAALLDDHPASEVAAVALGGAGAVLLPVAALSGVGWVVAADGLAMAVWLGVVTVALAYPLLARGLGGVGVAAAATLTLAEPATAAVLGLVLLDESISGRGWVGLALVAAGVAVEAVRARNRR
jgi:DME family drug/metabolite transporter